MKGSLLRCQRPSSILLSLNTPAKRYVQSSRPRSAAAAAALSEETETTIIQHTTPRRAPQPSALARLPLTSVLRTYMITRMSSSPLLLSTCFYLLRAMLDSDSIFFSPRRNRVIGAILRHTFYTQFCAGETPTEVRRTAQGIRDLGFKGIMLEFALEVLDDKPSAAGKAVVVDEAKVAREIETWRRGMLDSITITEAGDFVGLKWSGLGTHALHLLKTNQPPTSTMAAAIDEVCALASSKGVSLLPGAEEEITNKGIDAWTLDLQRKWNTKGRAVMYTTFQLYLKSAPDNVAKHIAVAREEGFTFGAKLVRGAYLGREPRAAIWDTIEDTHAAYDGVTTALLKRQHNEWVKPMEGTKEVKPWPNTAVFLATHNDNSVRNAQTIRNAQAAAGEVRVPLHFAQLQGMADEVSLELVQSSRQAEAQNAAAQKEVVDVPQAIKCVTWGTVTECLHFLIRRASENKDAAGRTEGTRRAMGAELKRRFWEMFGLR